MSRSAGSIPTTFATSFASTTRSPDRAAHAVYDRQFAEFPGLYKAQTGMFARVNRHRRGRSYE